MAEDPSNVDDASDTDDVEDEDAGDGGALAPTGWRARLTQSFYKPPSEKSTTSDRPEDEKAQRPLTDAEVRAKVMMIDPTERKIGYLGSALGIVMALVATIPYLLNPKSGVGNVKSTSKTCSLGASYRIINHVGYCHTPLQSRAYWLVELLVLLAFPVAILVTVRIGRRSPLAYASLMTGLAFEVKFGLLGLPFLFAGGWLLIRAWKSQKYGSPTAKRGDPPLARAGRPAKAAAGAKATTSSTGTRKSKKGQPEVVPSRRPAEANKRYTPKTPTKKKVPPAS